LTSSTSPSGIAAVSPSSTTVPGGVLLGRDMQPHISEPCRAPRSADGSAWQFAPVRLGSDSSASSYFCNMFSGATGSIDFVLGKGYAEFTARIGFAVDSTSVGHTVLFEVIGDDGKYLAEPKTLHFGEIFDLKVSVSDVSRLRLRITETGQPGGSDAPSKPSWINPTLRRKP
jgi:hypothetical protein